MENPDTPSKWDDLARELGAEAPPEPVEAPKPKIGTESKLEPPRRKAAEPPARPKAPGWDNLASDFGLEVPPPPPPPPAPVASRPAPAELSPPRDSAERRDDRPPRRERPPRRDDSPRREERPRRDEASEGKDRPPRPPRREREQSSRPRRGESRRPQRDDGPRLDREDTPRRQREQPPQPEREDASHEEALLPPALPEMDPEQKPTQSLGVSLWHKIFGSPDQQAERIAGSTREDEIGPPAEGEIAREERPRDDRNGRRGRRHEKGPSEREAEAVEDISESWSRESVEIEFSDSGETENRGEQTTDENGEPRRRRRRRGRGRGRGRRSEGQLEGEEQSSGQREQSADESDEASAPQERREQRGPREARESRGRGGRSGRPRRESARKHSEPKDDFDDDGLEEIVLDDDNDTDQLDLGIDGEDDTASTGRDVPAGHKSIPSWNDAIGMIVDTNLSTRTDRRRSSAPQSRGNGSSRGRSRGGRRRKKT